MNRPFKNVFMILVLLATSIASAIQVVPIRALGTLVNANLSMPPEAAHSGELHGVWGADVDNIFAAGIGNNGSDDKPLVYHTTNGSSPSPTWTGSVLPMPGSTSWTKAQLFDVWGADTSHVYAVGAGGVGTPFSFLQSTFNGTSWTSNNPAPAGWTSGELHGIWGTSTSNILAVGFGSGTSGGQTFVDQPLVLRRVAVDGAWGQANIGLPSGAIRAYLRDIWGLDATHIYTVGRADTATTNLPALYFSTSGFVWDNIPLTLPSGWTWGELYGVWGSSASDMYAVGTGGVSRSEGFPLVYHCSGSCGSGSSSSWLSSIPGLPSSDWSNGHLYGVQGFDASNVYLIGVGNVATVGGQKVTEPLLYRKTSNSWAASNYPPAGFFYGIWGTGANNVYVVGNNYVGTSSTPSPLLMHATTDTIPPGAVTNLTATSGSSNGSVRLTWTAPSDDEGNPYSGPVDSYIVRYADSAATLTSCSSGNGVTTGLPTPVYPGQLQTMTVSSGLDAGKLYYFTVCAKDEELTGISSPVIPPVSAVAKAPGPGLYDDTYPIWSYTGTWGAYSGSEPFIGNTTHYTGTVGDTASFLFRGTQFTLLYTQNTNRGNLEVRMDGSLIKTINANGPLVFQKTYTSPVYAFGTHTVQIRNGGGGGGYIDVDAIRVFAAPVARAGSYEDTSASWYYSGSWGAYAGSLPFSSGTMHYTGTAGDSAYFTFEGVQFILTYTQHPNRGNILVYVDGSPAPTITATGALVYQKSYTSPVYASGTHVIEFRNGGGGGGYIDIDAIRVLASATSETPGVGVYDDTYSAWAYSGSWTAYSGGEAFSSNTTHYTGMTGDTASFSFQGSQFILTYTQHTNRGNLEVRVDGNLVATINANGPLAFQKSYTSPVYPSGTHTVVIRNGGGGGGYIDVDAIRILATPGAGAGSYDDSSASWYYSGSWATYSGSLPFGNGTMHYTGTAGDAAYFTFTGVQFTLTYTQHPNRGNIEISEVLGDGSLSAVGTLNANGVLVFQKTYTSPVFAAGTHLIRFRNAGGGGGYMDVDAIRVLSSSISATPGAGVYDDTYSAWAYSGTWGAYSGAEAFSSNTMHYTGTTGDTASFAFEGTQFVLLYTQNTNRGNLEVRVDGTLIKTINANGPLVFQSSYTSPVYTFGPHTVQIRNGGGGGGYIDIDAIRILDRPAAGVGSYEDTDAAWSYSGSWATYAGSLPFSSGTMHYSATVGTSAYFTFQGTQFILSYTQHINRGTLELYEVQWDGSLSPIGTIDAHGELVFQKSYTSPVFASGTHVIQVRNGGGGGGYIDIDAIQVLDSVTAAVATPGAGWYEDTYSGWSYAGAWTAYSGAEAFSNNTTHYTGTAGDSAYFTFEGSQFTLFYTQHVNRGYLDIYLDGDALATINANGALVFQSSYTSPVFTSGTHVIQFRNGGGGGGYIDIDAIQIK